MPPSETQIFVQRDGVQHGPFSLDLVRQHLRDGSFLVSDMAWHEGAEGWKPLGAISDVIVAAEGSSKPPSSAKPPLSSLAVVSLVLGLLALPMFAITSVPAIVCGHLAHAKIKKSHGSLGGKIPALIGLVSGYLSIPLTVIVMIGLGLAAGSASKRAAKNATALTTATAIGLAADNFYNEYGDLPGSVPRLDTASDVTLAKTLKGKDIKTNPRAVVFLYTQEYLPERGGFKPATSQIVDPWGNGYRVVLDVTHTAKITVARGGISEVVTGRRAAVYSAGPDGQDGTDDDLKAW